MQAFAKKMRAQRRMQSLVPYTNGRAEIIDEYIDVSRPVPTYVNSGGTRNVNRPIYVRKMNKRNQSRSIKSIANTTIHSRNVATDKRIKQKKISQFTYGYIDGFVHRFMTRLFLVMSEPFVLIMMSALIMLIYIHHYHVEDSYIDKISKKLNETETTRPIANWINENTNRMFGIVMCLIASTQVPAIYTYSTLLISIILILVLPKQNIIVYFTTTMILVLYHKLKLKTDRIVIIVVYIAINIIVYYDDIVKYHVPAHDTPKSSSSSKPKQ
ncbi:putative protein P4 [Fragaria vesca associated virus 1]|nr:putative protein P4 [Fragaria vesca associated virus 1]